MDDSGPSGRNVYPIRQRISLSDAVNNIKNWLEDDDNNITSESELESSSEEELEGSSNEDLAISDPPPSPDPDLLPISQSVDADIEPIVEPDDSVGTDLSILIPNRKRGRPKSSTQQSKKGKKATKEPDPVKWDEIVDNLDTRAHEFRFIPSKDPGVLADLNGESTPLEIFNLFFDDEVQDKLATMLNEFAETKLNQNNPQKKHSRYSQWYPFTRYELVKLIAVLIVMGIDKKPKIQDYWSLNPLYYSPWFHEMFSRNRFQTLYSTMLNVGAVGDDQAKKDKIEPFLNLLITKFQSAFYPGKDLSLDEMVVKWKGRSKYKMYNPNKPEKYHLKTFGLCDSKTGYAYNLLIYFGSATSYEDIGNVGQSEKIFNNLLNGLGQGHHVFADRYYTTFKLIQFLTKKKIYYTGTLQSNRINFPPEIKTEKLNHTESKFYRCSSDGILTCIWKDKKARKPVIAVSTYATKELTDVTNKRSMVKTKPTIFHEYNQSMNGCDRMDQMVSYYNVFNRKTIKWWKRLIVWTLELSQVNAYILFCLTRDANAKKTSLLSFKETLVKELIVQAELIKPHDYKQHKIALPNVAVNCNQPAHLVQLVKDDRNCKFCSGPANRKRTKFMCSTCKVYLHPKDCFQAFHL